jgi:hypothetical protein
VLEDESRDPVGVGDLVHNSGKATALSPVGSVLIVVLPSVVQRALSRISTRSSAESLASARWEARRRRHRPAPT